MTIWVPVIGEQEPLAGFLEHRPAKIYSETRPKVGEKIDQSRGDHMATYRWQCRLHLLRRGLLILLPHTREHNERSKISGLAARHHAQVFDIRKACIWVLTCESHVRSYRRCDSSCPRSFRKICYISFRSSRTCHAGFLRRKFGSPYQDGRANG